MNSQLKCWLEMVFGLYAVQSELKAKFIELTHERTVYLPVGENTFPERLPGTYGAKTH